MKKISCNCESSLCPLNHAHGKDFDRCGNDAGPQELWDSWVGPLCKACGEHLKAADDFAIRMGGDAF
jgi:hypothetical protein